MKCRYCGAPNDPIDHRCARCGRRLHVANARPAVEPYPVITATAPDTVSFRSAAARPGAVRTLARPVQPSLFPPGESGQVIPFETFAPNRPPRTRSGGARPRPASAQKSPQQSLELMTTGAVTHPRALKSSLDSAIYCDAPVASPAHRLLAFFIDFLLAVSGVGLLGILLYFAGGPFPQNQPTLLAFAAFAVLVYILYEALWCIAAGETLGMRWTHLHLLDFDGRRPALNQRLGRLLSYFLSVGAAGLGLVWALADEENLAWHDHMSNTFPTFVDPRRH